MTKDTSNMNNKNNKNNKNKNIRPTMVTHEEFDLLVRDVQALKSQLLNQPQPLQYSNIAAPLPLPPSPPFVASVLPLSSVPIIGSSIPLQMISPEESVKPNPQNVDSEKFEVIKTSYRSVYGFKKDIQVSLLMEFQLFIYLMTHRRSYPNWAFKKEFSPGELLALVTTEPDNFKPYLTKSAKRHLVNFISQHNVELLEFFAIQNICNKGSPYLSKVKHHLTNLQEWLATTNERRSCLIFEGTDKPFKQPELSSANPVGLPKDFKSRRIAPRTLEEIHIKQLNDKLSYIFSRLLSELRLIKSRYLLDILNQKFSQEEKNEMEYDKDRIFKEPLFFKTFDFLLNQVEKKRNILITEKSKSVVDTPILAKEENHDPYSYD